MSGTEYYQINKVKCTLLVLGCVLLFIQSGYAQTGSSGLGAITRMGHNKIKPPKRPVPGEMGGGLLKDRDCIGKLQVNIAGHPSAVRVGQSYSFVALSTGGCKGTYKYMWSGRNLNNNTGKATGLLNRNYMTASFKNPGTSTISVAVVDAKNNKSSDRIILKVLPRK